MTILRTTRLPGFGPYYRFHPDWSVFDAVKTTHTESSRMTRVEANAHRTQTHSGYFTGREWEGHVGVVGPRRETEKRVVFIEGRHTYGRRVEFDRTTGRLL